MKLEGGGDISEHYRQSMHVYAMEIEGKEVWDFSRGNYIHRLIQNQIDGKMVPADDGDV